MYVKEGISKLFDKTMMEFMYSSSRLKINLETNVTKYTVMEDGKIELEYYFGGDKKEVFDAVVIATPLEEMETQIFNTEEFISDHYKRTM